MKPYYQERYCEIAARRMTLHVYTDLVQGTDEWLEARRGIVTASVIGQLITSKLKVADNATSRGLCMTLAAERITGQVEDSYVSFDMQRGIDHEPYARDAYAKHFAPVEEVGFMVREIGGRKLGYSPDGLVGDDGLIEIKSPRAKEHVRTILDDEVPDQYKAQLQAGLLVSGREWIDYVSFCGGLPLYVKRVMPDPKWQVVIADAALAAEETISEYVDDFEKATQGMPATERVPELMEFF